MIKKVRLFWSYQVDKTERWLEEMALQGWHLIGFNLWNRVFTFKRGEKKDLTYRIQYGKYIELSPTLLKNGWNAVAAEGKWMFLSNEQPNITLYPVRDAMIKRNRLHAYLFSLIAIFLLSVHIPIYLISFALVNTSILPDGLWTILPLFIVDVLLAAFAIYVFRSYRSFEVREMDASIHPIKKGEKMRKIKLGWMYHLEETKEWLERMAEEGYELEKVKAALFTFRRKEANMIKYECAFEFKVQPSFFSTHKELGWQLKFSSNISLLNYSIWAMPYDNDAEVPQFTYDKSEKRESMKRAFKMNIGMSIYLIAILSFSLYTNTQIMDESFINWSFSGFIRPVLCLLLVLWCVKCMQIFLGHRKNMRRMR
ncbi:DUF2812 domain-containing protein [Aquibacillus koreensis]|uniref:DUF2812 domain-containing protein n=1 Tax=Aquibacillus koreensis TaxID=279446 RepID=A0A9X4AGX6_9BACI|nr:DUF2812 domain-containing protein [Aquibacillus koreensis]MCT2536516.1 DUF2812 domain-containing protein [Aquibacillus koreensis]MDC3419396.1 DUF2812 domain-containing protein [Aquibacillus koreensis]